ncbi:SH2 domain-containing protein [Gongronella butleri]|nr:SH2 domain-containing protein [Gongronella butleri]
MSMFDSDNEVTLTQQQRQRRTNRIVTEDDEDDSEEGEEVGFGNDSDDDDDEEDEDEDEEEARKVAEGFIVDDDEEQEDDEDDTMPTRRKKKRRAEYYDEELDEEDLELLEENTGLKLRNEPELKRLKRGRQLDDQTRTKTSMDIFSDEEGEDEQQAAAEPAPYRRRDYDDMGDFIADEDEDDLDQLIGDRRRDEVGGFDDGRKAGKDILDMLPEGISEDVLMDMYDIFGDGGDYEYALYPDDQMELEEDRHEPQLADIFEPSELAERMLTEEDEKIRNIDVPERLQMRYEGLHKKFTEPSMEEIQQEGIWVARQLGPRQEHAVSSEEFLTAVTYVVGFFTKEFLEVPYIKDHRRDFFTSIDATTGATVEILSEQDLWEIYDLDFKYHGLQQRKKTLRDFLTRYDIDDEYVREAESKVDRTEDVTDILDYVNCKFATKISAAQAQKKGPKRPVVKSFAALMANTPAASILPLFGLTARQFGENWLESKSHFTEDAKVAPLEEAEASTTEQFPSAERVLKGARMVLAQEMALDMQVRKAARRDYEANGVINVRPTEKGFTAIDDLHALRPFKYVSDKPLASFKNGEFLALLKGEADGLLTVSVGMYERDAWVKSMGDSYLSDGTSTVADEWNHERGLVLQQAVDDHLAPLMEKHIRERLRVAAQETVCKQAAQQLYAKVNTGPFRTSESRHGQPRVIAVSNGDGDNKSPTMAVMLSPRGKVKDQLILGNLRDARELVKLEQFIHERRPHVVGVAGFNAQVRHVIKYLTGIIQNINHARDSSQHAIELVVVDDEAARLYKNSKRAHEEFPDSPEVMRYAIALARRLQNPLLEYTGLGRDLLTIRFQPYQHLVNEDILLAHLERSLISVVNDMGIDINAAVHSPHIASALPYICGLGPRKAHSILKKVEVMGELDSRNSLVMDGMTAANTFVNCASFIRIRDVDGADILDDTRIHPEDYELARKMAGDALEIDEDEMDDFSSKVAVVTRVVKEYPERLNDLILDDYAAVLREQYNAPKRQILEHIKLELQGPYHDRRARYAMPTMDQVFSMVTGETNETLRVSFIVPAKVMALRGRVANCVLDSGLDGIISYDYATDDHGAGNVDEVLSVGQTLNCKVLHIDREKFVVELSSRASDTQPGSDLRLRRLPLDPYYDENAEKKVLAEKEKQKRKKDRANRKINHPLFRPMQHKEAEDYLATRPVGDLVIRPSSKGTKHIAITWKVAEGVYQHINVIEEKPNAYSAPTRFLIGDQAFEDLDELIVTYVEAIAQKVDDLISHPKFQLGGPQALDDYLDSLTRANPKKSEYGFCLKEGHPGYFDLAFKLNQKSNVTRWPIKVLPDGYRMQKTAYPNVDDLINGFKRLQQSEAKKRYHQQQQQQQQQQRSSRPPGRPSSSQHGGPPPQHHAPPPHHMPPPPHGGYGPPPQHHGSYPPPPQYAHAMRPPPHHGMPPPPLHHHHRGPPPPPHQNYPPYPPQHQVYPPRHH